MLSVPGYGFDQQLPLSCMVLSRDYFEYAIW